jgi:hypothetical protein
VDLVAVLEQELGQERAVLPSDASDKCDGRHDTQATGARRQAAFRWEAISRATAPMKRGL